MSSIILELPHIFMKISSDMSFRDFQAKSFCLLATFWKRCQNISRQRFQDISGQRFVNVMKMLPSDDKVWQGFQN